MIMYIIFEVVKEESSGTFPRHWPLAKLELKHMCCDSKSNALSFYQVQRDSNYCVLSAVSQSNNIYLIYIQ